MDKRPPSGAVEGPLPGGLSNRRRRPSCWSRSTASPRSTLRADERNPQGGSPRTNGYANARSPDSGRARPVVGRPEGARSAALGAASSPNYYPGTDGVRCPRSRLPQIPLGSRRDWRALQGLPVANGPSTRRRRQPASQHPVRPARTGRCCLPQVESRGPREMLRAVVELGGRAFSGEPWHRPSRRPRFMPPGSSARNDLDAMKLVKNALDAHGDHESGPRFFPDPRAEGTAPRRAHRALAIEAKWW